MHSRNLTYFLVKLGVLACMLAAIWDEDTLKWVLSAVYLNVTARYFGVVYRHDDKVVGQRIIRPDDSLNFLNLKAR